MDNFNALSKSAILTKLALDGYFIDLLTLNSFIKEWQIEAIYENEFGIEFFDNNSYLTILDKLKAQYSKTKKSALEAKMQEIKAAAEISKIPENNEVSKAIKEEPVQQGVLDGGTPVYETKLVAETLAHNKDEDYSSVSLEELAENAKEVPIEAAKTKAPVESKNAEKNEEIPEVIPEYIPENNIMPSVMKNLKPGPVAPNSNIVVDHSYTPSDIPEEQYSVMQEQESQDDLLIIDESFTADEIEKANNLINKAGQPLPESITETYFEPAIQHTKPEPAKETVQAETPQNKSEDTKADELDLMQLAQSFAQNLAGGDTKDVPPADLEQIFKESYTDSFSELQDYVQNEPEEYKSLQEDLPSDIAAPEVPKQATHFDSSLASNNASNLSADDIRSIIREEITRQTASIVPVPQNNENVKEILREIVKQTADVVPQNAFKLDISQGTLDMIAKTIAKKIAIKLNSYYKLNSSKQNEKLQLFRQRTIELKEKNQMLADENRKLKARLLETSRDLESYKPAMFGLFKYTGRKRR